MAAPLSSASQASPGTAPAADEARLPSAPQTPEKADPNKPLKNVQAGEDDSKPDLGNPYFPRYGSQEEHDYFVHLSVDDSLNKQKGKNALRKAKAWLHFEQAAMGLRVPRSPGNVQPEAGDVPNVTEHSLASAAGSVDRGSFSYDNPFSDHYASVVRQMAQSAAAVHNS